MTRAVVFHPLAEMELAEASAWYEEQRDGLGAELLAATEVGVGRILEAPHVWPTLGSGRPHRRYMLKRFPYFLIYVFGDNELRIVAFAHAKRKPEYWSDRE